jgi:predicted amidohydrolase
MMISEPFIATAVQYSPVFLDLEKSIEKASDLISQAAREGAQLIVFPETWLTGYPLWFDLIPGAALWDSEAANQVYQRLFENSPTLSDPAIRELGKAAKAAGAIIVMGLHERDGSTLYNTTLYVGADGEIMGHHRKLVPTYTERLIWGRGDGSTLEVFDTPLGCLGGLICWEHWMPLARYNFHAQQELIHVAQWPTVKTMHQIASRHYAIEGRCFVIAAGTVMHRDEVLAAGLPLLEQIPEEPEGLVMRGGSCIIGPDGEFLAEPVFNQPAMVTAEIDPQQTIIPAMTLDVSGHYARPDVFTLQVNTAPQKNIVWKKPPST